MLRCANWTGGSSHCGCFEAQWEAVALHLLPEGSMLARHPGPTSVAEEVRVDEDVMLQ